MISILFMAADPTNASRLRLGEELREIQEKLQLSKSRDTFALHQRMSVRPADISQALLDTNPKIVHFSGHGTSLGALCIENKTGEMHPIQPEALAAFFKQFANHVECVILNACYSAIQADAIAKHIWYVIGMSQAVGDRAAIAFSVGFYQALGAGRSIEDAYKLGCVQIRLENISEHLTPLIKTKQAPSRIPGQPHSTDWPTTDQATQPLDQLSLGNYRKLRHRERVDTLIHERKYEEAMELDPANTIAVMKSARELVRNRQFEKAAALYLRFKQINHSGVGYSVYPQLGLAFEKTGDTEKAIEILRELEQAIHVDIIRGYGYLSRSQQLSWLLGSIQEAIKEASDIRFIDCLKELKSKVAGAINTLCGNL